MKKALSFMLIFILGLFTTSLAVRALDNIAYKEVSNLSELTDGSEVVIASTDGYAFGAKTSDGFKKLEVSIAGEVLTGSEGMMVFTIGVGKNNDGTLDGKYNFISQASRLTNNGLKLLLENQALETGFWDISIGKDKTIIKSTTLKADQTTDERYIGCNTKEFKAYTSNNASLKLYRKVSVELAPINYHLNNKSLEVISDTCVLNQPVNLLKPTFEGYEFLGWYDSNDNPVTTLTPATTDEINLYAKWKQIITSSIELVDNDVNKIIAGSSTAYDKFDGVHTKGDLQFATKDVKNESGVIKVKGNTGRLATITPVNNLLSIRSIGEGFRIASSTTPFVSVIDNVVTFTEPEAYTVVATGEVYNVPAGHQYFIIRSESTSLSEIEKLIIEYTDFRAIQTKTSLAVTYKKDGFIPTSIRIRFGGIMHESLYDSNAEYGVVVLPGDDARSITGLTVDDIINLKSQKRAVVCNPFKVDEGYQFAWVINNTEGHLNYKFKAAMYMIKDNTLYLSHETVAPISVVDTVNEYKKDKRVAVYNTLFDNILAKAMEESQNEGI